MKFLQHGARISPLSPQAHSSIMQFKQILLMFSALVALAYSFPAGVETNGTSDFAQFESNATDALELKNPPVVIVEDRIPKTESVVVEFVYNNNNGDSLKETKGTNKDKYDINSPPSKKVHDQTKPPAGTDQGKLIQEINPTDTQGQENESNIPNKNLKNPHIKVEASLITEEISPLSEKWPKYYYEAFNPIQAFPELQYYKENRINAPKEQNKNSDAYLPLYENDRKQSSVAGPPLSPISVYDREFVVPFY